MRNPRKVSMARSAKRRYMVFLSHSSKDMWVAKQIAREIKGCGAEVFLDEAKIQAGADFAEEILTALDAADELVVLLTPWAMHRPYVLAELGAAWIRRIPIVVLLHGLTAEDLQSRPEIPLFMKKRNLVDLNKIETYFGELRNRARK